MSGVDEELDRQATENHARDMAYQTALEVAKSELDSLREEASRLNGRIGGGPLALPLTRGRGCRSLPIWTPEKNP